MEEEKEGGKRLRERLNLEMTPTGHLALTPTGYHEKDPSSDPLWLPYSHLLFQEKEREGEKLEHAARLRVSHIFFSISLCYGSEDGERAFLPRSLFRSCHNFSPFFFVLLMSGGDVLIARFSRKDCRQ